MHAGLRGEGGARARICNPLPGGFGHQPSTMTGARGARQSMRKAIARVLKNASRERLVIASVREAIQAEMSLWIASSLPLLAMTKTHREKDFPMRKTKTAKLSSELKHAARFEAEKA